MIFFLALIFIIVALIILMMTISSAHFDYFGSKSVEELTERKNTKQSALEEFEAKFTYGENFFGKHSAFKIFLAAVFFGIVCCFGLGPYITNPQLGLVLGLVMTVAYTSRFIFHYVTSFRSKLLQQLERIFMSIRNNLSTGMTLDYAVNESIKYIKEEPLGPHLRSFVKLSEGNFLERFPSWLHNVQRTFRLKELAESAQLLSLELAYTNNQEEAFINAAKQVSNRFKTNKKQRNTLNIGFITLDFMTLGFLGLVLLLIPQISEIWWTSEGRPMVVFSSAIIVWLAYAVTVSVALWRQS